MKLNIPRVLEHNGERFMLHAVEDQKTKAVRLAKKLEKERKRFRIKHINDKFVVYRK